MGREWPREWRRNTTVVVASSAILLPMMGGCGQGEPVTVPVAKGSVISGVQASGLLRHVDRVSIGFPEGGKITEISVKVGDKVKLGQPIAQVDNTEEKLALRKAKNQVAIDKAALDGLLNSYQPTFDRREIEAADKEEDLNEEYLRELVGGDERVLGHIKKRYEFDQQELWRFKKRARANAQCLKEDSVPPDPITGIDPEPGIQVSQECLDLIEADKDVVNAQRATVLATKGEIIAQRELRDFDNIDARLYLQQTRHLGITADSTKKLNATDKKYAIIGARAQLDNSLADLEPAQKAFDESVKPSAYWGTVDGINGRVGQVMMASHQTPATGAPAGSEIKKAATSSVSGMNLITLKDVDAYQVVVTVPNEKASQLGPDKTIDVTYDELPGFNTTARIASVVPPAPGDTTGNAILTAVINEKDGRLADGLHANLNVALDRADNVLTLPSTAVTENGRTGMVTVKQADGTRKDVSVELGKVGDQTIEIVSGVKENDEVVAFRG